MSSHNRVMATRNRASRWQLSVPVVLLALLLVACGEEPFVAGSDEDATTTSTSTLVDPEDDEFDEPFPVPADDYSDGLPVEVIDIVPNTLEEAVQLGPLVAVVEVIEVGEGLAWNTETGEIGLRSEWEEANLRDPVVAPEGWQEITLRLVEPIKGSLGVDPGEVFQVAYPFAMDPSFHPLDESFLGASGVITASRTEVAFQDSSRIEMTFLSVTSRFAREDGPAVCLYCLTVGSWRDAGGLDQPVPDRSGYAVAQSLDEVIERARNPNRPIHEHLGYQELVDEGWLLPVGPDD